MVAGIEQVQTALAFSTQFSTTDNNVVDFWALGVFRSGLSAFLEHAVS